MCIKWVRVLCTFQFSCLSHIIRCSFQALWLGDNAHCMECHLENLIYLTLFNPPSHKLCRWIRIDFFPFFLWHDSSFTCKTYSIDIKRVFKCAFTLHGINVANKIESIVHLNRVMHCRFALTLEKCSVLLFVFLANKRLRFAIQPNVIVNVYLLHFQHRFDLILSNSQ